jgi:hypothetical protein
MKAQMMVSVANRSFLHIAFVLLPTLSQAEQAPLAELLAAETTETGINVTVPTGGCTKKTDFEVRSQDLTEGKAIVELRRLKPDDCKGNFPEGLKLTFTWSELKLPAHSNVSFNNHIESFGLER